MKIGNFTLLHDNVMLFPIPKTVKTASGIILKDNIDATAPIEGFVVGAGPGKLKKNGDLINMPVKIGDRVVFVNNSAQEVKHEGDVFLVVPVSEILCVVNKTE